MKYNEAIDMILDGGRAYDPDKDYEYTFIFDENILCGFLQMRDYDDVSDSWRNPLFTASNFTETDWIVEKDGVVYEEKPNGTREALAEKNRKALMEIIGSLEAGEIYPEDLGLHNKKRFMKLYESWQSKQDKPAQLEESIEPTNDERDHAISMLSKRYGELEEFRRKIEGDWLERKMLCFTRRFLSTEIEPKYTDRLVAPDADDMLDVNCEQQGCHLCCTENRGCDVCFPQEQPKEEPSGKVTVEDMEWMLEKYIEERDGLREAVSNLENNETIRRKETLVRLNFHYLIREIKYLVSLQEKIG